MIDIYNLEKRYSSDFTLKIDELHIDDGERVAIIGQNGSGKSTLLRILSGFIKADSGTFSISAPKNEIGYQPQQPFCFRKNVETNIRLGVHYNTDINELINNCNLNELRNKTPSSLSGGEKQRMCFARMLAGNYKCLLLDEPLSATDIESCEMLENLLLKHCKENGTTLLMSTHLPSQALKVSTKVLILNNGNVEEYSDTNYAVTCPSSEFGQKFINQWRIG